MSGKTLAKEAAEVEALDPWDPSLWEGDADLDPDRKRAWYYDWTPDKELSGDLEGCLVWLCRECAEALGDLVSHASDDEYTDYPCWRCGR